MTHQPMDFVLNAGPQTNSFIDGLTGVASNNARAQLFEISGDFALSVRVVPTFSATYDAGSIFVYSSDTQWIKIAFELTDLGYPSVVSVVTNGYSDDANGERIEGDSVWLRLLRRGDAWCSHFSLDGKRWAMTRYFSFSLPLMLQVGVAAQSPMGEGCTVQFSDFRITENGFKDIRQGR